MNKLKPVLLALSMMLVTPLAVQAAEITLVPAVKLQIVWGGDRFCMVVMWGKKGAEAMNDGGCEAR